MSDTAVNNAPAIRSRRLVATLGPFGFFGRGLLFAFGELLVVPMPWTTTGYLRYLCSHLALPDGRQLRFAGKPGDIWHILIGIPLLMYAAQAFNIWTMSTMMAQVNRGMPPSSFGLTPYVMLLAELASFYLGFLAFRWAVARTTSDDGRMQLTFVGNFFVSVGWLVLVGVSTLTIIGWAWVAKLYIRWLCQNVDGTMRFDFIGSGWSLLWRVIVVWALSILIIPIPWMIAWLTNWIFSNVTAEDVPQT